LSRNATARLERFGARHAGDAEGGDRARQEKESEGAPSRLEHQSAVGVKVPRPHERRAVSRKP
jgi:hypothetical protein